MLSCSEHARPIRSGVAYRQLPLKGPGMTDADAADLDDGALILAAVGAAVRECRIRAGLTQAELAQRAGIGRPHLNHIEGGRKNPTVVVLVHLARSLGVAPGELLTQVVSPGAS